MKRCILLFCNFFGPGSIAMACTVCERRQPELLRGISHGAGPESRWDLWIVAVVAAVVAVSLFFSVKWILRPGETSADHIKRSIFK
ncbi:hypothetical protein [Niabella drilacis]|uniref:Uncharacterized protein n=1 Tax=Niabella drilacis (strain DSM 25811 / CCM 8410 / CCUG 62505 / LMG 26954 / E90) TaxID=1285928 RepID=A0A1G6T5Y9_NIADE|nr:hypothetical protein [Niabella drilacis]SDD23765.1 hypothetical protein SAMN04487894_10785 [Niabella drilacis]